VTLFTGQSTNSDDFRPEMLDPWGTRGFRDLAGLEWSECPSDPLSLPGTGIVLEGFCRFGGQGALDLRATPVCPGVLL